MSKGKTSNLDNGFLLLYDWLPALEDLSGEDVKALLFALIERQRNGTELPTFENPSVTIYAKMIEPTIIRRLDGRAGGLKAQKGATQVPTQVPTHNITQGTAEASKAEISKAEIKQREEKATTEQLSDFEKLERQGLI